MPLSDDDVARVIEFFALTQPEEEKLARSLLHRGGRVIDAWGPLQMAVWHLVVQYKNWFLVLHSERGFGDLAIITPATNSRNYWAHARPIGLAIFVWARANGVSYRLDTSDDIEHDLSAYGGDALDWLVGERVQILRRVHEVWLEGKHSNRRLQGDALKESHAATIVDMEEAAALNV